MVDGMQAPIDFVPTRNNLSEQIARHLERMILTDSRWREGSRLPSEAQLCETYGVSRPVIREALKTLQASGLVELKNGLGAFVRQPGNDTVEGVLLRFSRMHDISDEEFAGVRNVIEIASARLAAEHASDEQLAKIGENLEAFEQTGREKEERVRLDREFHNLIAQASANRLLAMFQEVLVGMLSDYMAKGVDLPGGIADAITRHKKIYEALKRHDVEATGKAMAEHLDASLDNVKRYNEGDQR